jgi:hypothetical protein
MIKSKRMSGVFDPHGTEEGAKNGKVQLLDVYTDVARIY